MRRKLIIFSTVGLLLLSGLFLYGNSVQANIDLFLGQFAKARVEVNGTSISDAEVPPFIVNNRTVVPLSQVAELFNAYTEWDAERRVAMVKRPTVNMAIIQDINSRSIRVNQPLRAGEHHNFHVATQVINAPISKNLKARVVVVNSQNSQIYRGIDFELNTEQNQGNFWGNISVANITFSQKGNYFLRLQIEDPSSKKFITIGECLIVVE